MHLFHDVDFILSFVPLRIYINFSSNGTSSAFLITIILLTRREVIELNRNKRNLRRKISIIQVVDCLRKIILVGKIGKRDIADKKSLTRMDLSNLKRTTWILKSSFCTEKNIRNVFTFIEFLLLKEKEFSDVQDFMSNVKNS